MKLCRILAAIVAAISVATLAACSTGLGRPAPTRTAPPCNRYEPQPLMQVRAAHGITPTHSVRVDIFRCVGTEWVEIFGSARVDITAGSDAIASGAVRAGANAPWPYQNLSARTPFEFPLMVDPGLSAVIEAHVGAVLDEGDMIACWIVFRDGRDLPGSRGTAISPVDGAEIRTSCRGLVEG